MSIKGKRLVSLFLLFFLCLHFTLIVNYAAPVSISGKLKAASSIYTYPYFYQQWTVFVPVPGKRFDLMIRNGEGNKWQAWTNLTSHLLKRREKWTALLGRETEVLLMTNAISYLAGDLGEKDQLFLNRPDLPSFKILEHAARNYFRNFRCWKDGKEYELLLITTTHNKTIVYYFKNLSLK